MSQKYERLKTLLKELFQLDRPDLDFGLYRIMHAKSAEVTQFLDREPEQDNLALDEWFSKQGYSSRNSEFDPIFVNGGNNLENLKAPDDTWKVRLIEEDFHRLMFETEGV
jgi:hypothetical protein